MQDFGGGFTLVDLENKYSPQIDASRRERSVGREEYVAKKVGSGQF